MTLGEIGAFFGISVIAAAINSVAGGGTFLTFPVFILNGLTPLQANVMSTVALWPGTLASAYGYRHELEYHKKKLIQLLIVCAIGGTMGSLLLINTPESVFSGMVPWLLLLATLIFTFGRHGITLINRLAPNRKGDRHRTGLLFQFAISVYGGYFGAGIGILMLAMLQLIGFTHIHRMNAYKTVLGAAVNATTVCIFVVAGRVMWAQAPIMIAGAMLGGYAGARLALNIDPKKIRLLVSAIGFGMTAYFFLRGR